MSNIKYYLNEKQLCCPKPTQCEKDLAQLHGYYLEALSRNNALGPLKASFEVLLKDFVKGLPCDIHFIAIEAFEGLVDAFGRNLNFRDDYEEQLAVYKQFVLQVKCKPEIVEILAIIFGELFFAIASNPGIIDELVTIAYTAATSIAGNPKSIIQEIRDADAYSIMNNFNPCSTNCYFVNCCPRPTQCEKDLAQFNGYYLDALRRNPSYIPDIKDDLEILLKDLVIDLPCNVHFTVIKAFKGFMFGSAVNPSIQPIMNNQVSIYKQFVERTTCRPDVLEILAIIFNELFLAMSSDPSNIDTYLNIAYTASASIAGNPENITQALQNVDAYTNLNNFIPCPTNCFPGNCCSRPTQSEKDLAQLHGYYIRALEQDNIVIEPLKETFETLLEGLVIGLPCNVHFTVIKAFNWFMYSIARFPAEQQEITNQFAVYKQFVLRATCKIEVLEILAIIFNNLFIAISGDPALLSTYLNIAYTAATSIAGNPANVTQALKSVNAYSNNNNFILCPVNCC